MDIQLLVILQKKAFEPWGPCFEKNVLGNAQRTKERGFFTTIGRLYAKTNSSANN